MIKKIILLMLIVFVAGCGGPDFESLNGKWKIDAEASLKILKEDSVIVEKMKSIGGVDNAVESMKDSVMEIDTTKKIIIHKQPISGAVEIPFTLDSQDGNNFHINAGPLKFTLTVIDDDTIHQTIELHGVKVSVVRVKI